MTAPWLQIQRGDAPLIVSFPHTGTEIPADFEATLQSGWLARKDTDWYVDQLYDFVSGLGATTIRTAISRTVIDVNRDPSGASLYPGQATTALCPLTTFDGEALYHPGKEPSTRETARRRKLYFEPYHAALRAEIERLRMAHPDIVIYDAHAIRSIVPRLFDGVLPHLNIGTDNRRTAAPVLQDAIERACMNKRFSMISNDRFRGGWSTRHYGNPTKGVHAVQMELACRGYLEEPGVLEENTWPPPYSETRANRLRLVLTDVLKTCLDFCRTERPVA